MRKFIYLTFLIVFSLFSAVFTQTANAQQQPIARWYFVDKSYTTGFQPFDALSDRVTSYGKEYESIAKSPYFIYAAICAALDPQSEAKATQQAIWHYQRYIPTDQFKTKKFEKIFAGLIEHYRELAKTGKLTLPAIKMYGYITMQKGFQYDFDTSTLILTGDFHTSGFGGEAWGLYTNKLMIRFAPLKDNVNPSNEFAAYGGAKFSFPINSDSAEKIYNELKPILRQTSVGKATDALWYYITYVPKYNPKTFKFYNNPLYAMESEETTVVLFKGRCIYRQYEVTFLQSTDRGFTLNCSCNTKAKDYHIHKGEVTMSRIIYIGMDVHSQSFSLCAFEPGFDSQGRYFAEIKVPAEPVNIKKYVERLRKSSGDNCRFVTGYEAGCLGFSLYNALVSMDIECVILAPSTMLCPRGGKRIKTDRRDARNIAGCLAYGGYSPVHVPSEQDAAVRDYIRMRDDHADMLRAVKQQVCSLCLRNGFCYTAKKWTGAHLKYLREIRLSRLNRECLDEYLATLEQLQEKIKAFDVRIEEMSHTEEYDVKSARMSCFLGITRNRAMSILSEIGDFSRFRSPASFAAYLGLVPGERSSGADTRRTGITKAGNVHIRKELIEAAQSICRGRIGHKGKALAARQQGNPTDAVAYADKCSERLRRRYYKMINAGKNRNVVVTAIARELACFICGMMQGYAREAA